MDNNKVLTKRNTFLNKPGYKSFNGFDTLYESKIIACFLNANSDLLKIQRIEKASGLSKDSLRPLMSGKTKTMHPDSIVSIIPVLNRLGFEMPPKQITLDVIQNMVTRFYGISIENIQSELSPREISKTRQVCMFFSVEMTKNNYEAIGYFFGGRDHSSVSYSIKTVNDLIETDKKFRLQINYLRKRIKPS